MMVSAVYRNVDPSPAVKRALEATAGDLERFFRRILRIDWVLSIERGQATVACRVHAASGRFNSSARAKDLAQGVHEAAERILTQRLRKKGAREAKRRAETVRSSLA